MRTAGFEGEAPRVTAFPLAVVMLMGLSVEVAATVPAGWPAPQFHDTFF